jgi:transposase
MSEFKCVCSVLIGPPFNLQRGMEKIPRTIKHDAIALGRDGYTQSEIKDILGISISTIQRTAYKLRDHGDIEGGTQKPGPKAKLSRDLEDVILSK